MPQDAAAPANRPQIDLEDVRVFAVVARTLSISAAARELRLAQGAVTRRVEALERSLEVRLLARSSTGVTLTERGREAYDKARTIQRLGEEFERILLAADTRAEGRVTIAAPDFLSTHCLAPHVPAFLDANPGLALALDCGFWEQFRPSDPPDIRIAVEDGERGPDDVWTPLATLHYCAFASTAYVAAHGKPKSVKELVNHRLLGNFALNFQRNRWNASATALKTFMDDCFVTNCGAVSLETVRAGGGICPMPSYAALVASDLEVVLDAPLNAVEVWLTHHRDAPKTTRVKLTLAWLRQLFDHGDHPWFRPDFVHPRDFETEREGSASGAGKPSASRRRPR
jgi:DNA-binding transcriptional LysR family regulator